MNKNYIELEVNEEITLFNDNAKRITLRCIEYAHPLCPDCYFSEHVCVDHNLNVIGCRHMRCTRGSRKDRTSVGFIKIENN